MTCFEYDRNHLLDRPCALTSSVAVGPGQHKHAEMCSKLVSVSSRNTIESVSTVVWPRRRSSEENSMLMFEEIDCRRSNSRAEVPHAKNTCRALRLVTRPLADCQRKTLSNSFPPYLALCRVFGGLDVPMVTRALDWYRNVDI